MGSFLFLLFHQTVLEECGERFGESEIDKIDVKLCERNNTVSFRNEATRLSMLVISYALLNAGLDFN